MAFQSTRPLRGATLDAIGKGFAVSISIHAPLAGRDYLPIEEINSTQKFQSTRPLRGATVPRPRLYGQRLHISIHAPLAGRDLRHSPTGSRIRHFNPRAPCGARLPMLSDSWIREDISIHAPLAGRDDADALRLIFVELISIHAPLAGRDQEAIDAYFESCKDFNPRAPCGARPSGSFPPPVRYKFQSTRPLRGATPLGLT